MTGVPTLDVLVRNEGSVFLLEPRSNRGEDWLQANLAGDPPRLGRSYAVEPRYVGEIVSGMLFDGLGVR